ncbi:MAG: DUF86 domain-containing protein [Actinomycetota bacterium]|nr:DUF86 domain-containing protein [Actinomycetota bacterium]
MVRDIRERGRDPFLHDLATQAQAERHLQLAIQSAIDIAMHVLAENSAETPEDYGAAFTLLARHGLLDDDLANRLRLAAGLRNILVHGYLDVDPQRVWEHLNRLSVLVDFAAALEEYLPE